MKKINNERAYLPRFRDGHVVRGRWRHHGGDGVNRPTLRVQLTISGLVGGRVRRVRDGGVQRLRYSVLPYSTAKNARAGLWKRDNSKREFEQNGWEGNLKLEEEEERADIGLQNRGIVLIGLECAG